MANIKGGRAASTAFAALPLRPKPMTQAALPSSVAMCEKLYLFSFRVSRAVSPEFTHF